MEERLAADHFSRKLDEQRPPAGWSAHRERCLAVEHRTKCRIDRWQGYEGVHGVFSLAFLSFYYDADDKIVDIDATTGD